jgi:hypothetical protein
MLESVAVPAAIWKKPEDMEACLQDSWETTPEVSVLLLLSLYTKSITLQHHSACARQALTQSLHCAVPAHDERCS